jgi:hypothetical protein
MSSEFVEREKALFSKTKTVRFAYRKGREYSRRGFLRRRQVLLPPSYESI